MTDEAPRYAVLAQERSRKTYKALLRAARSLWWKRGFDAVSVGEICEKAGVAKGSFYFYFPKKDDLLVELGLSTLDPVLEHTLARLAGGEDPHDVLRETIAEVAAVAETIPKPVLKRINEVTMAAMDRWDLIRGDHASFGDIFAPIFWAGAERGDLTRHYSAIELAAMLSWAVVQAQHSWAAGRTGEADLESLLLRRAELFWAGAANRPVPHRR